MPKVGDKVTSVVTIQGTTIFMTLSGEVVGVKGDDVEVELNLNDNNKGKIPTTTDKLTKGSIPNSWNFPLQINTSP